MVSIDNIKVFLRNNISREKYNHTLWVAKLAVGLAKHYKLKNIPEIEIAAFLHDCQKKTKGENNHSFLASKTAREIFKIENRNILNAIKCHTFGCRNMNVFSKIIYIADISEPSRKYKEAETIRKLAFKDLDEAMVMALSVKMKYVLLEGKPLSLESVVLYNKLIKNIK